MPVKELDSSMQFCNIRELLTRKPRENVRYAWKNRINNSRRWATEAQYETFLAQIQQTRSVAFAYFIIAVRVESYARLALPVRDYIPRRPDILERLDIQPRNVRRVSKIWYQQHSVRSYSFQILGQCSNPCCVRLRQTNYSLMRITVSFGQDDGFYVGRVTFLSLLTCCAWKSLNVIHILSLIRHFFNLLKAE